MVDAVRSYEDGKFQASDFATVKKNFLADVNIRVNVQTRFGYDDPNEVEKLISEAMDIRSGIFKLESSEQSTPSEALCRYRARSAVEHLIHSLKKDHRTETAEGMEGVVDTGIDDTGPPLRSRSGNGEIRIEADSGHKDEEGKNVNGRKQAFDGIHGLVAEPFDTLQDGGEGAQKRSGPQQLESHIERGFR